MISNMGAILLVRTRIVYSSRSFAELVLWRLPKSAPGSVHRFKYRLAYVVDAECVVRYDNEAGKGDHRHIRGKEMPYGFVSLAKLRRDFESDMRKYGGQDEEEDSDFDR